VFAKQLDLADLVSALHPCAGHAARHGGELHLAERLAARNHETTSSVISPSTASRSPAALAFVQVSTRSRIAVR
jgi:hypothetical protein